MSSFSERLKEERDRLHLSQTDFAALADSSKASQINYEAGKRAPDSEYLTKIAASGVDILYLFSGLRSVSSLTNSSPEMSTDDFVYVRRYDVNLSAGPGMIPVENADADQLAFSRAWMRREGLNGRSCGLLRVRGDSMHPTVQDGAMVLVEMSDEPIAREGIYALCRDGVAFVKRMIPVNKGKDGRATSLVILSDNPAYPPDVLVGEALNEIRIVGRIRCAMTAF